jgi:UPF0176 protein
MPVAVAAFYKFVAIDDPQTLRGHLRGAMEERGIKGTILLATEGINGTISGAPDDMRSFLALLRADARFADLATNEATTDSHPFQRLKVKVKREIISFGQPAADPSRHAGTYVAPADWNALIAEPDVVVLDTRNDYEVAVGTFDGAVDPKLKRFGAFPEFVQGYLDPGKHRRIAMFCTGGIRCEKASAYMKLCGFEEVYHLKGGILNYLAQVPPEASRWQGDCFVFDEREAVGGTDEQVPSPAASPDDRSDRS